jgi:hypothetical protein
LITNKEVHFTLNNRHNGRCPENVIKLILYAFTKGSCLDLLEDNKTIKDKKGQKNVLSTDKISFYQNESWNLFTDSNKFPLQHQKENYKLKHCIKKKCFETDQIKLCTR